MDAWQADVDRIVGSIVTRCGDDATGSLEELLSECAVGAACADVGSLARQLQKALQGDNVDVSDPQHVRAAVLAAFANEEVFEQRTQVPKQSQSPVAVAEVGQRVGRYRLLEPLPRGGMSEVWRAEDPNRRDPVVIKFLPQELRGNRREIDRLRESFQHVQRLHHEHICPVYDVGESVECGVFLVLKCIEGVTLAEYRRLVVSNQNSFPIEEVRKVLLPVARALDYSHSKGIVHRDIKPANIIVSRSGDDVQLVDFGLAEEIRQIVTRISGSEMDTAGTWVYMAPEVWRGKRATERSDQYALAVVAYELLCGHAPFEASEPAVLRLCVLNDSLPGLPVGNQANEALARGLAKEEEDRFGGCVAFIDALTKSDRAAQPRWRHRRKSLLAVLCLGLTLGAAVYFAFTWQRPKEVENQQLYSARNFNGGANLQQSAPRPATVDHVAANDDAAVDASIPTDTAPPIPAEAQEATRFSAELVEAISSDQMTEELSVATDKSQPENGNTHPPAPPPPPLMPPFDVQAVAASQQSWALHLGRAVRETSEFGIELALIPPGGFEMGFQSSEPGLVDAGPTHWVDVPAPFYISVHEVTQGQYESIMGSNPSYFGPSGLGRGKTRNLDWEGLPVESVSWHDAMEFCRRLTEREQASGSIDMDTEYRLPTEAEWEYITRGGLGGESPWLRVESLRRVAWFYGNSGGHPHPVATREPNAFGICDLLGNVSEWCWDAYAQDAYLSGTVTDAAVPFATGRERVVRGGSWLHRENVCQPVYRLKQRSDLPSNMVGFRVVRTLGRAVEKNGQ